MEIYRYTGTYETDRHIINSHNFINCVLKDESFQFLGGFSNCKFENVIFDFEMYDISFHNVTINKSILKKSFEKCTLNKVNFNNSKSEENLVIKFIRCLVVDTLFRGGIYYDLNFVCSECTKLKIHKVKIPCFNVIDCIFESSTFQECKMPNSLILSAYFESSTFRECEFSNSHFKKFYFISGVIKQCIFDEVKMLRSSIKSTQIDSSRLLRLRTYETTQSNNGITNSQIMNSPPFTNSFSNYNFRTEPILPQFYHRKRSHPFHKPYFDVLTETVSRRSDHDTGYHNYVMYPFIYDIVGYDDDDEDLGEVIDTSLLDAESTVAIDSIEMTISNSQMAFEVIEGEVPLLQHLKDNIECVAFLLNNDYYITDRENIKRMISYKSQDEELSNSIAYRCIVPGTLIPENIEIQKPLVKIASLGLMANYSYMPIAYFRKVLESETDRIYRLIKTDELIPSVISFQAYHHMVNYVGASHCQAGQAGTMFKLQKIHHVINTGGARKDTKNNRKYFKTSKRIQKSKRTNRFYGTKRSKK